MYRKPEYAGDSVTLFSFADNQPFALNFDNETLRFFGATGDTTVVRGNNNTVGYVGGGANTLTDMGAGTSLVVGAGANLTVNNFHGTVYLPFETAPPVYQFDGHGGSLLTTWNGASIDFVGEVVPVSQIVSSVAPALAFIAPPAPAPVVAQAPPADPTLAPELPPGYVGPPDHPLPIADSDTTLYQQNGIAVIFEGNGDTLSVYRSVNDYLTAKGTNQTFAFSSNAGPNTVVDHGTNLALTLSITMGELTVMDFGLDPGGHVTLAGQTGTLAPDGHGGTMLSLLMGGANVGGSIDFVGDPNVTAAQIHTVGV